MNRVVDESHGPSVRLRRVFNTSIEHLFDCFTDPSLIVGWWGPAGSTCPGARADLVVGGSYRFEILGAESAEVVVVCGEYVEIDSPNRLVFTWRWEGGGDETTRVTLAFRALPGTAQRAELELLHERFASLDAATRHNEGWSTSLDCLSDFIHNERKPE
jgi:uncharacterized protein YndB with AHSA1/START domain